MNDIYTPDTISILVPTKVQTTLTSEQLVSTLGMCLFGDPSKIKKITGMDMSLVDFFIRKTVVGTGDEKTVIKEVCYADEGGKVHVYDDRGKLYYRWRKMLQAIVPNVKDLVEVEVIKNKET